MKDGKDGASSGSEDDGSHPADKMIIDKARMRKKTKGGKADEDGVGPEKKAPKKGTKRKRSPDAVSGSEDEGVGTAAMANGAADDVKTAERQAKPARQFKVPVGVTLIGDDEEVVEVGMQKTMRRDRYFTKDAFRNSARKCFNCGQPGHFTRDCPNERAERPCTLCAKFGHTDSYCPANKPRCYKCNRLGHISRECPNSASGLVIPMVCQRCGDPDCAASGQPDWIRAEGGCSIEYAPEDLADTMCLSCMKLGHINCKPVTAEKAHPSCSNCGGDGHMGTECRQQANYLVLKEKLEASNSSGLRELAKDDERAHKKGRWELEPNVAASYWQMDAGVEVRGGGASSSTFTYKTEATRYAAAASQPHYSNHAVPPPQYPTYSQPVGHYQGQPPGNAYQMYQQPPPSYPQNNFGQHLPQGGFTMGYVPPPRQPQRYNGNAEASFPRNRRR